MLHCSNKQPPALSGSKQQRFVSCSYCAHLKLARSSAHHSHLGTQANGKSPSQRLLVRVPEGKVSCERSCIGYYITQNWYTSILPPSSLARTIHMSLPQCRDAESATLHILEGRKTRTIWSSTLMITLHARSKTGIKVEGKYQVWGGKNSLGYLKEHWTWSPETETQFLRLLLIYSVIFNMQLLLPGPLTFIFWIIIEYRYIIIQYLYNIYCISLLYIHTHRTIGVIVTL